MKRYFLMHLVVLPIQLLLAQNTDSLKKAVFENSHDTDRVKTYLRLSHAYLNSERDTAIAYAWEALSLARHQEFPKGEAQALNMIGSILEGTSNYPKALEHYIESLKIAERIDNRILIAALYNNIAKLSTERSDFRTALEYFFKARDLFEKQENREYLSTAFLNIGDVYARMGKLDSAFQFQEKAYAVALSVNYTTNLGTILSNLGSIAYKSGESDRAQTYFRSALRHLLDTAQEEDIEALCGTYYGLAEFFRHANENDSARYFARQSLALSLRIGDQKRMLNASKLLNDLYESAGILDSAYKYFKMSSEIRESILSDEKNNQIKNMEFAEKERQRELAWNQMKAKEERRNNLQLFGIALFIINFFAILIIIRRRRAHPKALKYLGLLGLLLLFEFIAVFIHPYIANWTHHNPVFMLLILVAIAAVLVPLHHRLEHWVREKFAAPHKAAPAKPDPGSYEKVTALPLQKFQVASGEKTTQKEEKE